jgi:membrane-associated phospholipid phosphatase
LVGLNDSLYLALNDFSGRSWFLDAAISLAMDNPLVKAGPIAACFAFCWFAQGSTEERERRRRILLATLASLAILLFANRTLQKEVFLPRPFILSQPVQMLEGNRLIARPPLHYNVPLAGEMKSRFEQMRHGDIPDNFLRSFPSDHAAFFTALALGIFLACRTAGVIALLWTAVVVLLSRMVSGMHSPADIAVGAAIGAFGLFLMQFLAARQLRLIADSGARLTLRYEGHAAAVLSLVLVEVVGTLDNTKKLMGSIIDVLESVF